MARTHYRARWGFVAGQRTEGVHLTVGPGGLIEASTTPQPDEDVVDLGDGALLPGCVNAHSHAFQRAIRGRTQARDAGDPSSFWSWRQAMYATARALTPAQVYAVSHQAYTDMVRAGITTVGEFHYLHHQPDGSPYDDPNELAWQVVRAAQDAGIRLVLLNVLYQHRAIDEPPAPEQARFCDRDRDHYLTRVDALRAAGITVGLAPHSVRAVGPESLAALAEYAAAHDLPIHMHVSEQRAENEQCAAALGKTPTQVCADSGCFDRAQRFTAVHAIHLDDHDREQLATQSVCACPTTEADLGDGTVAGARLREAGTNLALGSDSNAVIDLIQEARALEMHERLAREARLRVTAKDGSVASALAEIATAGGARSLHQGPATLEPGQPFDAIFVRDRDPLNPDTDPQDRVWTAGTAAAVERVYVGGARLV